MRLRRTIPGRADVVSEASPAEVKWYDETGHLPHGAELLDDDDPGWIQIGLFDEPDGPGSSAKSP